MNAKEFPTDSTGDFEKETKKIKDIIKRKTRIGGILAWEAGEKLYPIKKNQGYKHKYKNFNDYTLMEFEIPEDKANEYINIYSKLKDNKKMITEKMLFSHLLSVVVNEDENVDNKNESIEKNNFNIVKILQTMKWAEENINEKENNTPYTCNIISIFKNILEAAKENDIKAEVLNQVYLEIFNYDKEEKSRKKREKKNPLEKSIALEKFELFKDFEGVKELYSYTPTSEQGFVGFFCTIFHLIKDRIFELNNELVSFSKIIYIRTEFPDAKIRTKNIKIDFGEIKTNYRDIDVEFEFNSFNYWEHKHHKSKEKCDLIICWEIGKEFEIFSKPPILCIKEILITGKIELYYGNTC